MIRRSDGELLVVGAVLGVLILLVCVPVGLTVLNSFRTSWIGQSPTFSLQNWRLAFTEPGIRASVLNTLLLLTVRTALSFPIAIIIAWLLARTDLPGKGCLEFLFWLLFFMPPLAITLGWILLLDGDSGLVNRLIARFAGVGRGPFEIYSFWGIVWTHLASTAISFKVILLTPLFRNLDAALEEASLLCGATRVQTARLIVLPAMIPAITLVLIAALLYGFQTFEIELILGTPIRFSVYSTTIYSLLRQEPPLVGAASALSAIMVLLIAPVAAYQRTLLAGGHPTLTGRQVSRSTALGHWKYPALAMVSLPAVVLTIVPLSMLVAGSFMKVMGYFDMSAPWTLAHWERVLTDRFFLRSVSNTFAVGTGTAVISVVMCSLVAYLALRSRFRVRYLLDTLAWLPIGLPGILVGVGLISVFGGFSILRPLYGTLAILIVAGVVVTMAIGTELIKTSLVQIDPALEEASRIAGASRVTTFRRILAPILSPVLMLVGVMTFARAAQEVGSMALLSTASTRPLSLLQIDYITSGEYESATVVATLISAMSIVAALLARMAAGKVRTAGLTVR